MYLAFYRGRFLEIHLLRYRLFCVWILGFSRFNTFTVEREDCGCGDEHLVERRESASVYLHVLGSLLLHLRPQPRRLRGLEGNREGLGFGKWTCGCCIQLGEGRENVHRHRLLTSSFIYHWSWHVHTCITCILCTLCSRIEVLSFFQRAAERQTAFGRWLSARCFQIQSQYQLHQRCLRKGRENLLLPRNLVFRLQ